MRPRSPRGIASWSMSPGARLSPSCSRGPRKPTATGPLGKANLSAIYAGRVLRLAQASPQTKTPVQTLRIGDICIGTTPCETFAETGLEFKKRSPFAQSFMGELAHGYYGYMPTPRHFALGGYETWAGTNALEPQASVKMVEALLEMAGEMR